MSEAKKRSTTKRGASDKTANGKQKVVFKGYVNWTLSEAHKQEFEAWLKTNPDIDDLVYKVVEAGYAMKVRYDAYNECLSASLYCTDPSSGNAGWTLSMRSNSWVKALERVLFVHLVAFDGEWLTDAEQVWNDDSW